jgi:hypothetical protein
MNGDRHPLPQYAFMAWCLIKAQGQLYFYLYLRLGIPSGLLLPGFPTKILYVFLIFPMRATCSTSLLLLDFIALIMFGEA